jgi:hypothetical protein
MCLDRSGVALLFVCPVIPITTQLGWAEVLLALFIWVVMNIAKRGLKKFYEKGLLH